MHRTFTPVMRHRLLSLRLGVTAVLLPALATAQLTGVRSYVEVYHLDGDSVSVVHVEEGHLEAPNWSPDGETLLVNGDGRLYELDLAGGGLREVAVGLGAKVNNDHGYTPDGRAILLSHYDGPGATYADHDFRTSTLYLLPRAGGPAARIDVPAPAFYHGIDPSGGRIVYTALRDGAFDVYGSPLRGGTERRLTTAPGLQDGPDYGPDGQYVYYNSFESGRMQIHRMRPDGSAPEQLARDSSSNWFPHPAPDGEGLVYLAYLEDQGEAHPALKDVALRYYRFRDGAIATLRTFLGGQGTINVPSWRPDGRAFAYVRYEVVE